MSQAGEQTFQSFKPVECVLWQKKCDIDPKGSFKKTVFDKLTYAVDFVAINNIYLTSCRWQRGRDLGSFYVCKCLHFEYKYDREYVYHFK